MTGKPIPRDDARHLITAENGASPKTGMGLAIYTYSPSCHLAQPDKAQRGTWGGARNRADRTSEGLTDRQVAALQKAAERAFDLGLTFQRHWIVHYGKAGIAPHDGARFVGKLIDLVSKNIRRRGGRATAIWVRERASDKGEHVHILLHLPPGMSLLNRTRRWIVAAGGRYQRGVSRVVAVRGAVSKVEGNSEAWRRHNAVMVLRYLLKGANAATGERLELTRAERGGLIVGKRCGWTVNIGKCRTETPEHRVLHAICDVGKEDTAKPIANNAIHFASSRNHDFG